MAGLECDALALIVVRLNSADSQEGELCWHDWNDAVGASPHGLEKDAHTAYPARPHKRLPEPDRSYFSSHVQRLLFPPAEGRGKRLMCCPADLYLTVADDDRQPPRWARVELLERLTTPLRPSSTFGLIHLSLLPADDPNAPDTLQWAAKLGIPFRTSEVNKPRLTLQRGEEEVLLRGRRPILALVEELFGDPHPDIERSAYTVLMAEDRSESEDLEVQHEWRRALTKRQPQVRQPNGSGPDRQREEEQTIRMGPTVGLALGRCTAFTLGKEIDTGFARNLRSYWGESIVCGLLQHGGLESFQRELADMGDDPLQPAVEDLYRNWLSFRNVAWWSQLSPGVDVPQRLVTRLRNELGTERLFTDLEGDLATYSDQRHRALEDRQARSLTNLQVYGSGIAVLSTLVGVLAVFGPSGDLRTQLVVLSVLASVVVALIVWLALRRD